MTRVLYIEDNDDNIYMLSRWLERAGYNVVIARDGAEGVRIAREQVPDIIIMDLSLPELDGWSASTQLKSMKETAAIPILALSAHTLSTDRGKALAAGCDDFDSKPVETKRLLSKIAALLNCSKHRAS